MDAVVAIILFMVGEKFTVRSSPYEAVLSKEVGELYGKPVISNRVTKDDRTKRDTLEDSVLLLKNVKSG